MWNVAGPVGCAKYSVMVSRSSGDMCIGIASETASCPAGTTVEEDRSKVTVCKVPGCTNAPSPETPTDAPATARGEEPYALDSLTRRVAPRRA
jgi:hypothetical protein